MRGFEFFGCTPKIAVPDQLRSAVSGPDRYDPEINPTYAELSVHYDVAIIPALPGEPRDKAKVETSVLIAQRWILDRARRGHACPVAAEEPEPGRSQWRASVEGDLRDRAGTARATVSPRRRHECDVRMHLALTRATAGVIVMCDEGDLAREHQS